MLILTTTLTAVSCLFIIGIGWAYLLRPSWISAGFGFGPDQPATPFHGVKGVRDLGTGVAGLALLAVGEPYSLGALMLAVALIPLGDMLLVLRERGSRTTAFAVHGATAVVVAATGALWILAA